MAHKDHSYLFITAVALVAIVGLIIVFTSIAPVQTQQITATAPGMFGQASYNNLYGQAFVPPENEIIVLPMQCSCGDDFYCTGLYTGAFVDCSCCKELFN